MSRVTIDTFGEIELSPATLHDNLQIMIRHDWIEFRRNHIYGLTLSGYQMLENDLYRWQIVTSRAIDTLHARDLGALG